MRKHHGQVFYRKRTPWADDYRRENTILLTQKKQSILFGHHDNRKKMGEANKEDGTQFGPWHREVSVPEMSDSTRGKRLDRLDDQCHMECKKICFRILDM